MQTFKEWRAGQKKHIAVADAEAAWNAAVEAARADPIVELQSRSSIDLAQKLYRMMGGEESFSPMEAAALIEAHTKTPSPCGQKFADGTPHPASLWREARLERIPSVLEIPAPTVPMIPAFCLVCASERKLRADLNSKLTVLLLYGETRDAELTDLREGLRKKILGLSWIPLNYRHDVLRQITPPAASGRCKACSAETVTADESGLCAPCRIVRDGLRASGRQLCDATWNIYGPCILPADHKGMHQNFGGAEWGQTENRTASGRDCNIVGCPIREPRRHITGGPDQNVSGREIEEGQKS